MIATRRCAPTLEGVANLSAANRQQQCAALKSTTRTYPSIVWALRAAPHCAIVLGHDLVHPVSAMIALSLGAHYRKAGTTASKQRGFTPHFHAALAALLSPAGAADVARGGGRNR